LKDVSARLGSHDYWRLRIGIGHPGNRDAVTGYVLSRPAQEDRVAIDAAIGHALDVLPLMLAGDLQGAMLKLHSEDKVEKAAPRPEKPGKAEKPAKTEKPGKPAKAGKAEMAADTGKAEKAGGFGSFLKKFLPDSKPGPKK
jgi:PTH1 family peptidyl-tRNA hydrolase